MLISHQLVHRVQCVPDGGAAVIPAYIFRIHFMVFCLNCQHFWSRGFICQYSCSSLSCEEKIHILVDTQFHTLDAHFDDAQKVKSDCEVTGSLCFTTVENNANIKEKGSQMGLWVSQCQK